ncbi:hypothetical protein MVLG_06229 [Microbotryum lychnidis-dioicae p1A1 Lamole]|uniref:Uncharacterized protein n=1 Tax=Microbotryum lychnidis-dioicae (strain p1A1 Lamole / MvSl-1064) TaxID=683840 RepID=U5HGM4_USTV1|nr:hypothetical protein MVLG_06229 [Microbotryum lychnidis-dioicae p1A1 Lamole]|eukprot:KDE03272.1 hypothetical protein MVLG_06229 [Microbotryum lychnidis-dioicae p1A1 Lamole]
MSWFGPIQHQRSTRSTQGPRTLTLAAYEIASTRNFDLKVAHVAGDHNTIANDLSRLATLAHTYHRAVAGGGATMTTTRGEGGRTVSFASRPLMAPARPAQPFPSLDQLVIGTAEMSLRALEPKTRSDYARAFRQWNLFVSYYRYPALPTVVLLCQFVYWRYRLVSTVYQTLSGLAHYFKPIMGDKWNRIRSCCAVKLVIIGGIKTWRRAAKRATPLPFASVDYSLKAGVSDAAVSYDHLVFLAMVALGFGACARCAELCTSNTVAYRDYNKLPRRDTVKIEKDSFIVHLPYHKANRRWQGSHFIVVRQATSTRSLIFFRGILLHETDNSRTQTSSSLRATVTLPHVHGSSVVFKASSDRITAGTPSDPAVQPTTLYEATQRIRSNI